MELHEISKLDNKKHPERIVESKMKKRMKPYSLTSLNNLDDGCLMHILSFLSPIPVCFNAVLCISCEFADRYNTALVCHRWRYLACHPRLWLRVDRFVKDLSQPGVFLNIESAVSAARPGDTILIVAGGNYRVSNIQIKKPLCLVGGGEIPDETTLVCARGSDRSGRLTIDGCVLQCETNPLDHLSCPIVSTAGDEDIENILSHVEVKETVTGKIKANSVTVLQTRIEGGAKAVSTRGDLVLQRVRVMYSKAYLYFWFDVDYE
ncbi:putative protein [Arabidopsis thaliana]|nr:putative protein [Arabidopsis thaliana]